MLTPILMYHEVGEPGSISEDAYPSWTVTPGRFREHLEMLAEAGYTGVSVSRWLEIRRDLPNGFHPVVLTFDDGFRGNLDHVIPALRERGWSATFFVVSGKMGTTGYGCPDDWRAAAAGGMDVGSHTVSHRFTGALPPDEIRRELLDSRIALEDAIGRDVKGLSWPNGDAPRRSRSVLRDCGYQWAATSRAAFGAPHTDSLALPRLAVRAWHDADGLAGLINSGFSHRIRMTAFGGIKQLARTVLGRDRYARLQMRVMD